MPIVSLKFIKPIAIIVIERPTIISTLSLLMSEKKGH